MAHIAADCRMMFAANKHRKHVIKVQTVNSSTVRGMTVQHVQLEKQKRCALMTWSDGV